MLLVVTIDHSWNPKRQRFLDIELVRIIQIDMEAQLFSFKGKNFSLPVGMFNDATSKAAN